MQRIADWEKRLARVAERHASMPGAWGVSDCWIATLDAIEAVTGEHLFPALRRYGTEAGGWRAFRKAGFATLADAFGSLFDPVARLAMHRGDVGLVERGGVVSCGFVTTTGLAVKTLYEGGGSELAMLPITAAMAGFKVGRP